MLGILHMNEMTFWFAFTVLIVRFHKILFFSHLQHVSVELLHIIGMHHNAITCPNMTINSCGFGYNLDYIDGQRNSVKIML